MCIACKGLLPSYLHATSSPLARAFVLVQHGTHSHDVLDTRVVVFDRRGARKHVCIDTDVVNYILLFNFAPILENAYPPILNKTTRTEPEGSHIPDFTPVRTAFCLPNYAT